MIQLTMKKVDGRKFGLSIASLPDGHYVEKVNKTGLAAETGKVSVGMKLVRAALGFGITRRPLGVRGSGTAWHCWSCPPQRRKTMESHMQPLSLCSFLGLVALVLITVPTP